MRIVVAIKSCERDMLNGCHKAIRETWGKDFPQFTAGTDMTVDVRFFIGRGNNALQLQGDEVRLDIGDDLVALPLKAREMAGWVVANGYDNAFFCDVDTYVKPDRLLACGFEGYDYLGYFGNGYPPGTQIPNFNDCRLGVVTAWAYASGGAGYFLSRKAAGHISKMSDPPPNYGEDVSIGIILGPLCASGELKGLAAAPFNDYVVWHHCTWGRTRYTWPNSVGFNPSWMYESYRKGQPW
jgi:hypothetical protein